MGRLDRLAILKPINLLFTPNQPEVDLTQTYGVKAYACQSCAARLGVEAARAKDDMSSVRYMGIDETSVKRGRQCITVVHDLEAKRYLSPALGARMSPRCATLRLTPSPIAPNVARGVQDRMVEEWVRHLGGCS